MKINLRTLKHSTILVSYAHMIVYILEYFYSNKLVGLLFFGIFVLMTAFIIMKIDAYIENMILKSLK